MTGALAFGLCYRIRGGFGNEVVRKLLRKPAGWEIPNVVIRSICSLCMALIVTPSVFMIPVLALAAYAGIAPGYFGGKFGLDDPANRNWSNYPSLTLRGMWICFPIACVMLPFTPLIFLGVFAGALFVPCYLAGNVIHKYCKLQGPSEWGEWLLALSIGMAL